MPKKIFYFKLLFLIGLRHGRSVVKYGWILINLHLTPLCADFAVLCLESHPIL